MEDYFRNKKILITGGLGFIGSNMAVRLTELGANITVIDNMDSLYGGNFFNIKSISNKIKVVIDDIRNMEILGPLLEEAEIVFHLAAQVSYIDSINMAVDDLDLNAKATLNILEHCKAKNSRTKIIFSSSRMVYGKIEQSPVTESNSTNPLSLYGIHKLTSEKYLLMYYKDFGIPCTILRLTNPYGPRQQIKHSKYSLVGWFVRQAMEDKEIKIFGDGLQLRDYIFIDDIVNAMLECAKSPKAIGEVINVGSGKAYRFCDMVKEVIDCVGKGRMKFVPWPGDYEKVETGDIVFNISKLKSITTNSFGFSLEEGINRTYEYYKKHYDNYT